MILALRAAAGAAGVAVVVAAGGGCPVVVGLVQWAHSCVVEGVQEQEQAS